MDITSTLEAKSSQLNTDDLIAGAKTITITKVSAGSAEQPVAVSFEGDGGKPWYPCKSMRRVLVAAWGADASQYVGRRVTLFRDPSVIYGGIAVGGIRVSHLSHLVSPLSIALTMTRQKRSPYKVEPLPAAAPATSSGPEPAAPATTAAPSGPQTPDPEPAPRARSLPAPRPRRVIADRVPVVKPAEVIPGLADGSTPSH